MTTSPASVCLLLTLSQLLPSKAPRGGWGSPLPGRGRGREKEVNLNPPLSHSVSLPSCSPPAPFLPPCSWCSVLNCMPLFPGHQALAQEKPRALAPLLSLPSPVSLSACGGFGCDIVQVPRQEPLGLAASLLLTEEVVEGVAGFAWVRVAGRAPALSLALPGLCTLPLLPDRFCCGCC